MNTKNIKKLNTLTILGRECPKCKNKNNDKTLVLGENDSLETRTKKEIEATKCEHCGFDIYNYEIQVLEISNKFK